MINALIAERQLIIFDLHSPQTGGLRMGDAKAPRAANNIWAVTSRPNHGISTKPFGSVRTFRPFSICY